MKLITLTQGKFAQVDDEDFEYLNQFKWYADKGNTTYYARGWVKLPDGRVKDIKMHRLLLNIIDSKLHGDHEDHDGLNNQRNNLRAATRSQNGVNRRKKPNCSSKYIGVSIIKNKYRAQIRKDQKYIVLGTFDLELDAAKAYNIKALELFGKFANLNIIPLS